MSGDISGKCTKCNTMVTMNILKHIDTFIEALSEIIESDIPVIHKTGSKQLVLSAFRAKSAIEELKFVYNEISKKD